MITYKIVFYLAYQTELNRISPEKITSAYVPPEFTGLNIRQNHSGSEGLIEMIKFKPEIEAYLSMLGIEFEDRSNLI